jgi:hypothetical protein
MTGKKLLHYYITTTKTTTLKTLYFSIYFIICSNCSSKLLYIHDERRKPITKKHPHIRKITTTLLQSILEPRKNRVQGVVKPNYYTFGTTTFFEVVS